MFLSKHDSSNMAGTWCSSVDGAAAKKKKNTDSASTRLGKSL